MKLSLSQEKLLGLIGLLGSAFIGGGISPTLIRTGVSTIDPFIFNWLRASLGFLLLLPFYLRSNKFSQLTLRENLPLSLILGLGVGLNLILFSIGIQHTTLVASQLIFVIVPVVVGIIAYFLVGEKLSAEKALGTALSISGICVLIFFSRSPEERLSLGTFYGNSIIFVGMLSYSSYIAFSKKYTRKLSILQLVTITQATLSVLFFPLALNAIASQNFEQITPISAAATVFASPFGVLFIGLVQLAIKNLSAATASMSAVLSPEFAIASGIFLYDEKMSVLLALSMLLSIGGVLISVFGKNEHVRRKLNFIPNKLRSLMLK